MAAEKAVDKITLDNILADKKPVLERGVDLGHSEKAPEKILEKPELNQDKKTNHQLETVIPKENVTTNQVQSFQQKRALEIDNILSEGLHDVYTKMKPERQKEFREAGEETVAKINGMFNKGKVKLGSIINLIRKWLKLVPGVNRFFLEQEAKIKADKIMGLQDK